MLLQKTDASNRPYETVQPLAVTLGMTPKEGKRSPEKGGVNVFDNRFEVDDHEVSAPAFRPRPVSCGICKKPVSLYG